ncbi:MAG: hypothetical protein K6F14_06535 [Clostridiales bacterium]|nr:hypothetical protein [Clostridiales bacterium]
MKNIVKVVAVVMAIAIVACVLASCGKLLSGTYKTDSALGSYVSIKFTGNKFKIETYVLGTLTTTEEGTYKITDDKMEMTYVTTGDGTTATRTVTESFAQDGDTVTIGIWTLKKS